MDFVVKFARIKNNAPTDERPSYTFAHSVAVMRLLFH